MGFAAAVAGVPCNLVQIVATGILLRRCMQRLYPAAGGVFPLGFGGQPVIFTSFLVQFSNEFLNIVPTYVFHRAIVTIFKIAWIAAISLSLLGAGSRSPNSPAFIIQTSMASFTFCNANSVGLCVHPSIIFVR